MISPIDFFPAAMSMAFASSCSVERSKVLIVQHGAGVSGEMCYNRAPPNYIECVQICTSFSRSDGFSVFEVGGYGKGGGLLLDRLK